MFFPQRPKILVADDQRVIADTLAMILAQNGYETIATYGGREAIAQARRWTPDLFVSDVSMPEVDGIRAAIEIHTLFPRCKVLLFSAEASSLELVRGARSQGHSFEFLEKPFHPVVMLDILRHLQAA